MKLALNRPVTIVIIGAGGTGGYVIPHLYRIAFASNRRCRIIIADGDIVEEKNLVRQNFAECDIGENKAQVMAERYSEVFGIETEYIPDFIENEERLYGLFRFHGWDDDPKPIGILIGAVDNNSSRAVSYTHLALDSGISKVIFHKSLIGNCGWAEPDLKRSIAAFICELFSKA